MFSNLLCKTRKNVLTWLNLSFHRTWAFPRKWDCLKTILLTDTSKKKKFSINTLKSKTSCQTLKRFPKQERDNARPINNFLLASNSRAKKAGFIEFQSGKFAERNCKIMTKKISSFFSRFFTEDYTEITVLLVYEACVCRWKIFGANRHVSNGTFLSAWAVETKWCNLARVQEYMRAFLLSWEKEKKTLGEELIKSKFGSLRGESGATTVVHSNLVECSRKKKASNFRIPSRDDQKLHEWMSFHNNLAWFLLEKISLGPFLGSLEGRFLVWT